MSPRAGVTVERVVKAAAELADAEGPAAVTLARVAGELGVRTPSLYNHVDGLDGLRRLLTLRALHDLGQRLQAAAVGRASEDAVRAIAAAYRRFALDHPGLYATVVPSSEVDDDAIRETGAAIVTTVRAVLSGYGLSDEDTLHAARTLRSAIHGFVSLELAGGFGLPVDVEKTFAWLVDLLATGLRTAARPPHGPDAAPGGRLQREGGEHPLAPFTAAGLPTA